MFTFVCAAVSNKERLFMNCVVYFFHYNERKKIIYDEHHAEHGVENQHDRRRGVRVQRHSHAGEIVRLLLIYIYIDLLLLLLVSSCENEFEFAHLPFSFNSR